MQKSKTELLEQFLVDAIENDFADLVDRSITLDGFDAPPQDDHDYMNHGVRHRSRASIQCMLKHNFSLTHPSLLSNICSAISYDVADTSIYQEILERIGKDSITETTLRMFAEESQPFKYLSFSSIEDDNEKHERLNIFLSYVDIDKLSSDNILNAFNHENVYANTHCLYLVKFFYENGLLAKLSEKQATNLFSYLSRSNDTSAINYCINKEVFSLESILSMDKENLPSFFLITEMFNSGVINYSIVNNILKKGFSTECYLKRFLSQFSEKRESGDVSLDHPSLILFCNLAFNSEDEKVNTTILDALLKSEDIALITHLFEKIITHPNSSPDTIFSSNTVSLIGKVFERQNNYIFLDMIAKSECYLDYVRLTNKYLESRKGGSENSYFKNDILYLLRANQGNDLKYTRSILETATPSQGMINGIISIMFHNKPDSLSFSKAERILNLLYPYIDEDSKKREFRRVYWDDEGFSLAKQFSSLEASKTSEKKLEKLLAIAFCPEHHVSEYLSNAHRSKNAEKRIKMLLTVRNIYPFTAMNRYSLTSSAGATLSSIISGL